MSLEVGISRERYICAVGGWYLSRMADMYPYPPSTDMGECL